MDKIKIRLGGLVKVKSILKNAKIFEMDDCLQIMINHKNNFNLNVDDNITFGRDIYGENGLLKYSLRDDVKVLSITEDKENGLIYIKTEKIQPRRLYVSEIIKNYDNNESVIWFKNPHMSFYQDNCLGMGQEIIFNDKENNSYTFEFKIPYLHKNAVYNIDGESEGGVCGVNSECSDESFLNEIHKDVEKTIMEYSFLPSTVENYGVIIEGFNLDINSIAYAEMKFNPYYYYNEYVYNETDIEYAGYDYLVYNEFPEQKVIRPDYPKYIKVIDGQDNSTYTWYEKQKDSKKHCFLYDDDTIWLKWKRENEKNKVNYINNSENKSNAILFIKSTYWGTDVQLGNESENINQGTDVDSIKASIEGSVLESAPIIDMERIKYIPHFCPVEEAEFEATGLTFYFHFRTREKDSNTEYTDGWGANDNTSVWWNGYDNGNTNKTLDIGSFSGFVGNSGRTSDLLGYLDFTDDDVYYRKNKVSKSFITLKFYDSNDPISQKLLYYSTVFLDSTKLYGNFIKQKERTQNEKTKTSTIKHADINTGALSSETRDIVFIVDGNRVDSQIDITNEYDRMRSAEGFNLYLFKDDFEIYEKQGLYLKVEFNHAGNGQTIPMILWPKVNGSYVDLTAENIIESLYIPVKIKREIKNDIIRYYYEIEGAGFNDKSIELILFEPKITNDRIVEKSNNGN